MVRPRRAEEREQAGLIGPMAATAMQGRNVGVAVLSVATMVMMNQAAVWH